MRTFKSYLGLVISLLLSSTSYAEEDEKVVGAEQKIELISITGSYIKRQNGDGASPVKIIGAEELAEEGNISLADITMNIPSNVGSEIQANIFRQNFSAGTAPMNLRGLGLGSTLVLVDGKRITQSAAYGQDGSSFVDINSIPSVMLKSLEILKDGAAATYGSDAVAGVANYKTKNDFTGIEISGAYQKTTDGPQKDQDLGFLWGTKLENTNIVLGVNYFKRDSLPAADRAFTDPDFNDGIGFSAAGQPGNYFLANTPGLTPDPNCEASGGFLRGGLCRYNYIVFNELFVPETRFQSMLNVTHAFDDSELYASLLVTRNSVDGQILPPSLPTVIGGTADDPAIFIDHPNNPFGDDIITAVARPFGANSDPGVIDRDNDTNRLVIGIKGDVAAWYYDLSYQHSVNDYSFNYPDVVKTKYAEALKGLAGPNHDQFFNPFGLSENSQEVNDYIRADAFVDGKATLQTIDFVATTDLWSMDGGDVVVAIGSQYRRESLEVDFSEDFESFDLAFLVGANDYDPSRNVYAIFSEMALPVTDDVEVQLALRYEDYSDFGSSVDPKISIRWNVNDNLILRSSASTAFRTPSLLQGYGSLAAVNDFPGSQFRADLTKGNVDLNNEEAEVYNIGLVFTPIDELAITFDYWRFDYKNLITKENAQNIFADWNANGSSCTDVRIRLSDNAPDTGNCGAQFVAVNTDFFNAANMFTDGIDFNLEYGQTTELGKFKFGINFTKILSLDIVERDGTKIDALGQRNYFNFARSNQEWRGNINLNWSYNGHSASAKMHYIGSYINDQVDSSPTIESHTTVDMQYSYDFENMGLTLTAGLLNAFDKEPPHVVTNFGFDTQTHDPRGRIAYIRFKKRFE
jgi:iron complex outermembrane recepter protein